MPRMCVKTGKSRSVGNRRSHSMRATKRVFRANIQNKRVYDPATGTYKRIKVATSYLRTLAKQMQASR